MSEQVPSAEWVARENESMRRDHKEDTEMAAKDLKKFEDVAANYVSQETYRSVEGIYYSEKLPEKIREKAKELLWALNRYYNEASDAAVESQNMIDAKTYRGQQFVSEHLNTLTAQAKAEAEAAGHEINLPENPENPQK